MPSKFEIERKWLLKELPKNVNILKQYILHQSYIVAEDDVEVRLVIKHRPDDGTVVGQKLTIKKGNGLSREEAEIKLTDKQIVKLLSHVEGGPPIIKKFFIAEIPGHSDLILHFSQVDPDLDSSFFYAEVEFPSEGEAAAFQMPANLADYVIREVTNEKSWQMKNYWRRTRMGAE